MSRCEELNPVSASMVSHPAEYPLPSYCGNALDKKIELLTPHSCYLSLGKTVALYKECYRALFERIFLERTFENIRNAPNKAGCKGKSI